MTNLTDVINESPKECRALIITLIVAITTLTTVTGYLYYTKESGIQRERRLCEAILNKKDLIIDSERARYSQVIDSILLNQRQQLIRAYQKRKR